VYGGMAGLLYRNLGATHRRAVFIHDENLHLRRSRSRLRQGDAGAGQAEQQENEKEAES